MYLYQYVLLAAFCCLLLNKETKFAACAFLSGWFVYIVITIDASASWYYVASAIIETCIAYTLNKRYRLVSYLGYLLVFVNLFGLYSFVYGKSPEIYDLIYAIISVSQLLILIMRGLGNGIHRLSNEHIFVRIVDFDSRQARDRM